VEPCAALDPGRQRRNQGVRSCPSTNTAICAGGGVATHQVCQARPRLVQRHEEAKLCAFPSSAATAACMEPSHGPSAWATARIEPGRGLIYVWPYLYETEPS
jgi:hypothetical protein